MNHKVLIQAIKQRKAKEEAEKLFDKLSELIIKNKSNIFKEVKKIDISLPLQRMKYDDAIKYYGSDKPDLRFDMKIIELKSLFQNTEITFLKDAQNIDAIVVKNGCEKQHGKRKKQQNV